MPFASSPTRHHQFYFTGVLDGPSAELVTFMVSNTLYRVYRQPLEKNSGVFAAMFAVPQIDVDISVEGLSDEAPIHLEGVPVAEFEVLLFILYPVDLSLFITISAHTWLTCIAAAERWDVPTLKTLALAKLENAGPAPRLAAARRFGMEQWRRPAFEDLCRRDASLTVEELSVLEPKDAAYITSIRETVYLIHTGGYKLSNVGNEITKAMNRMPPPK